MYIDAVHGGKILFNRSVDLRSAQLDTAMNQTTSGDMSADIPDTSPSPLHFTVLATQKSIKLTAPDLETKREWIQCIQESIDECNAGKNRGVGDIGGIDGTGDMGETGEQSADKSSTAALWQQDRDSKACLKCGDKFTFTRRRHHCRNCGLLVCGKCSQGRIILAHIHKVKPQRVCNECLQRLCAK